MSHRCLAVLFSVIGVIALSAIPVAAQTAPRTAWGDPDLQGVWDFRTLTPLERPDDVGEKTSFTDEEAAVFVRALPERDQALFATFLDDPDVAYELWDDRGTVLTDDKRTSLVVDPPDGKIPRTAASQARFFERLSQIFAVGRPDSHLDRMLSERCIEWTPTPLNTAFSNNNVQLFQTPDSVVILHEMIHDIRVIYLDSRPHLPDRVRQLRGSSHGQWEGDTLVVETKGFSHEVNIASFLGAGQNRRVMERFQLTDADTIRYEYTIDDPNTWAQPWTAGFHWKNHAGPTFEYACQEFNYGMTGILSGARAEEYRELTGEEYNRPAVEAEYR